MGKHPVDEVQELIHFTIACDLSKFVDCTPQILSPLIFPSDNAERELLIQLANMNLPAKSWVPIALESHARDFLGHAIAYHVIVGFHQQILGACAWKSFKKGPELVLKKLIISLLIWCSHHAFSLP